MKPLHCKPIQQVHSLLSGASLPLCLPLQTSIHTEQGTSVRVTPCLEQILCKGNRGAAVDYTEEKGELSIYRDILKLHQE